MHVNDKGSKVEQSKFNDPEKRSKWEAKVG